MELAPRYARLQSCLVRWMTDSYLGLLLARMGVATMKAVPLASLLVVLRRAWRLDEIIRKQRRRRSRARSDLDSSCINIISSIVIMIVTVIVLAVSFLLLQLLLCSSLISSCNFIASRSRLWIILRSVLETWTLFELIFWLYFRCKKWSLEARRAYQPRVLWKAQGERRGVVRLKGQRPKMQVNASHTHTPSTCLTH